ncbi:hypothetical protein RO21_09725 [[Actinobacillus] muris]|uniref:Cobalamin adenosyltransferase n=1 Tax=Muribacter muris TaxID=67855 RepID=A0A0J5P5R3_9PAST|nr:hypothetical protein [Muribacter muris]KMK50809.1 hypothetical protein RO21_09725 [[Actinobacillus] muris] [Muribacter muris]
MTTETRQFDWVSELHKTTIHSLTTSFGLDFLLFEDKKGGNVDTIHNARKGIYATEEAKNAYDNREAYDSHKYHSHKNYISQGKHDKKLQQSGILHDKYRNQTMLRNENRQLDHTISAKEIHNDRGRVLAGLDGSELANQSSNLNSTHGYINNLKREHSTEKFVTEIIPKKLKQLKDQSNKDRVKLSSMPETTSQQRNEKRQLKKEQEKIEALEVISKNSKSMIDADNKARRAYDKQINITYYLNSKFFKNSVKQAGISGIKTGMRQALGFILAEVWFELKEQIPYILTKNKNNFDYNSFIQDIRTTFSNIFERVKSRFNDILVVFRDASLSGVLANISTTLINIFATTTKIIGKIIREMYIHLINAAKLIFFNPDKLSLGELTKAVLKILATGISVLIGSIINIELNKLLVTIPFGSEISSFLSSLITGILTLGISYFLEYSDFMKKIWSALDNFFKNKYDLLLEDMRNINDKLDTYLGNLAKIEFNFNVNELKTFYDSLKLSNTEYEKNCIFKKELKKRNIEMPFEFGNNNSMVDWLIELRK